MTTYYIGADVHSNSTELAVEKNKKIVARYKLPTSIVSLSNVLDSLDGKKYLVFSAASVVIQLLPTFFIPKTPDINKEIFLKTPLYSVYSAHPSVKLIDYLFFFALLRLEG